MNNVSSSQTNELPQGDISASKEARRQFLNLVRQLRALNAQWFFRKFAASPRFVFWRNRGG